MDHMLLKAVKKGSPVWPFDHLCGRADTQLGDVIAPGKALGKVRRALKALPPRVFACTSLHVSALLGSWIKKKKGTWGQRLNPSFGLYRGLTRWAIQHVSGAKIRKGYWRKWSVEIQKSCLKSGCCVSEKILSMSSTTFKPTSEATKNGGKWQLTACLCWFKAILEHLFTPSTS